MKPFHFKQFTVEQNLCAMKVTLDACVFGAYCDVANSRRIIDIGSGTGLLSLMAAQRSHAIIDAVEIDQLAAQQALLNVQNSSFAHQIHVNNQSIIQFQPAYTYDTIICNPPFFTDHLKGPDAKRNQARHNDELSFHSLLSSVFRLLDKQGIAWFILPTTEYADFMNTAASMGFNLHSKLELSSRETKAPHRIIFSISLHSLADIQSTSLVIHGEGDEYSTDFKQLLKPYYLKL